MWKGLAAASKPAGIQTPGRPRLVASNHIGGNRQIKLEVELWGWGGEPLAVMLLVRKPNCRPPACSHRVEI